MLQGWFQVEVFSKGIEKELSFSAIKIEEGQFSFIIAQHGLVTGFTLALTALNDGVFIEWVHMKRSEQKHRHIDRQQDPGK